MRRNWYWTGIAGMGLAIACGGNVSGQGRDNGVADGGSSGSQGSGSGGTGAVGSGPGSAPACAPGSDLETLYERDGQTTVGVSIDDDHVFASVFSDAGDGIVSIDKRDGTSFRLADARRPWAVVSDVRTVYWVDDNAELRRVDKNGDNPQRLLEHDSLGQLAVDETDVYVATGGSLLRVPKAGGAAEVFAEQQAGPDSIAVDDDAVYWLNVARGSQGEVMRQPKRGGEARVLASGQGAQSHGLPSLVLDATHVYWAAASDAAIRRVPKLGGSVETVTSGVEAQALAIRDGYLYFNAPYVADSNEPRSIGRVATSGGSVVSILHSTQYNPWGIAVDADHVYWSSYVTTGPLTRACR